jgi:hypothetical protein
MAKTRKTEPVDIEDLEDEVEDLDEAEEEAKPKKASRKKGDAPVGITANMVAERLGTNGKTFRAWLRRKVEAGEGIFEVFAEREPRSRWVFPKWSDETLIALMKAWGEDDHTRGGGLRRKKGEGDEPAPAKAKTKAKSEPAPSGAKVKVKVPAKK